jgi:hypothetical protein
VVAYLTAGFILVRGAANAPEHPRTSPPRRPHSSSSDIAMTGRGRAVGGPLARAADETDRHVLTRGGGGGGRPAGRLEVGRSSRLRGHKAFDLRELLARRRAVLRRRVAARAPLAPPLPSAV